MPATATNEIRADFDRDTIVAYQAYRPQIAEAALAAGKFVPPFSFGRMTWIKPSFLWLMERCNWCQKAGQERALAVRITRTGWQQALAWGVLTQHDPKVYPGYDDWKRLFDSSRVHIQWDPERSLRGASLPYNAIQVGISRHVIQTFVDEWITRIDDYTPLVRRIYQHLQSGNERRAKDLLPKEGVSDCRSTGAKDRHDPDGEPARQLICDPGSRLRTRLPALVRRRGGGRRGGRRGGRSFLGRWKGRDRPLPDDCHGPWLGRRRLDGNEPGH